MSNPLVWYTDRSRTLADWKCPRSRLLGYHLHGRGVVPPNQGLELFLGTALHDGLAAIAMQWQQSESADIDSIATLASKGVFDTLMQQSGGDEDGFGFAKEQSVLVEGLLRGFYRHAWPSLIGQYPVIIATEQEMTYPLDSGSPDEAIIDPRGDVGVRKGGMVFMSRPDLVLGSHDGEWVYVEYKSTSSRSEGWVNQWGTAVQIHSTIRAIEHTLGKAPSAVIVQGLYKGYQSYGKQNSPFCYAYYRQGTPPFSYPEYSYAYKAGFKKVPVWELDGGLTKWIDEMPSQLLSDQFPQTPPLLLKPDLIERFFQQRLLRETEIREACKVVEDQDMPEGVRQQFMDGFFPQKFDQCNPAGFQKPCSFRQICHGGLSDPLSMGWTLRQSHHELEMKQHEAEDANPSSV